MGWLILVQTAVGFICLPVLARLVESFLVAQAAWEDVHLFRSAVEAKNQTLSKQATALLANSELINIRMESGDTPLGLALRGNADTEVVQHLLEARADPDAGDKGKSAVDVAQSTGNSNFHALIGRR